MFIEVFQLREGIRLHITKSYKAESYSRPQYKSGELMVSVLATFPRSLLSHSVISVLTFCQCQQVSFSQF